MSGSLDESIDMSDTAQELIFIRGVDKILEMCEKVLLEINSHHEEGLSEFKMALIKGTFKRKNPRVIQLMESKSSVCV